MRFARPSLTLLTAAVLAQLTPRLSPLATAAQAPDQVEMLAGLVERLEAARVQAHIPGMSIAVVQGGEVILARGFGLADVEAKRAADALTVYPIGSTTKAFTATVAGIAADEGRLRWDDPVTQHLPDSHWTVKSDDPDAECTLRDLLSHRHGFVRMPMLWMSGTLSRSEVLGYAAKAEPLVKFRTEFRYSNIGYLAAGEVVAAAMNASWDELVEQRIFAPLGMSSSWTSLAGVQGANAPLATGYRWDDTDQAAHPVPAADFTSIGPAGSIQSNVQDMAKWIRCQLGRGALGEERLVSEANVAETWSPQISMGGSNAYGLGWMLHEYRGSRVVEHGGAIDGFSAQVTLMPEEGIGYVLLMNLDAAPLREASIGLVLDALLGPDAAARTTEDHEAAPVIAGAAVSTDPQHFPGTYVANFAKFRDTKFTVEVTENDVQVTIPGQGKATLTGPDERGEWSLDITDRITLSFRGEDEAPCTALVVHQGPFAFEVPRERSPTEELVDVEALAPYLGTYRRARGGKEVKMLVAVGQLVMEDKGNWLALHTPDERGDAPLRSRADQGATFTIGSNGLAESFVFRGQAGEQLFTRIDEGEEVPSLRTVLELRRTKERSAALRKARGIRVTGRVRQPQSGIEGTFELYSRGRDAYAIHMNFGKFGSLGDWTNSESSWRYNPMRGTLAVRGIEHVQAQLSHPAAVAGDWRRYFDRISVARGSTIGGRKAYVVQLEKKGLPHRFYWVDSETGDVVRVQQTVVAGGQSLRLEITLDDFREIDGIRTAHHIVQENPLTGRTELTIEAIQSGLDLADDVFRPQGEPGEAPK